MRFLKFLCWICCAWKKSECRLCAKIEILCKRASSLVWKICFILKVHRQFDPVQLGSLEFIRIWHVATYYKQNVVSIWFRNTFRFEELSPQIFRLPFWGASDIIVSKLESWLLVPDTGWPKSVNETYSIIELFIGKLKNGSCSEMTRLN